MNKSKDVRLVDSHWPTRQSVISWVQAMTPWSMDQALAYNSRSDVKNTRHILPTASYDPVGYRLALKAIASALQGQPWESMMASALGYELFGNQLDYFWHRQFRILFPRHPQPLRRMNWTLMAERMAMAFALGWISEGTYQGYLTHASLRMGYQLQMSYDVQHKRVHALLLRLFAAWRGDLDPEWPAFAYEQPILERVLTLWREPDPAVLLPAVIALCDLHAQQSLPDTEHVFHDFSSMPCVPLELIFLFRLRELSGLSNPIVNHPLTEAPFDRLPKPQPTYRPDELMLGTLVRIRTDWPDFDRVISAAEVHRVATGRLKN